MPCSSWPAVPRLHAISFRASRAAQRPNPGVRRLAPGACGAEQRMSLIVQKYGGTSVGDAERIQNVARRVARRRLEGDDLVVVVSAMGDTTDDLIALARQVTDHPSDREMDVLLSTGEIVSSTLLAMSLRPLGVDALSFTGAQAGIYTDSVYGKARILKIDPHRVEEALGRGQVAIVAGFQGIT